MTGATDEAIAAATAYEDIFVTAVFDRWATKLLDTAQVRPGDRVLDVACGTGIAARRAAERTGAGAVVGLDPAPGMLAVAERMAPEIDWRQGSAEQLPFEDASFDAVVSQFGMMFFDDRPQALREMNRVLGPEGRLAVAVWDSLDRIPALAKELALLEKIAGPQAAEPLRAPFVLGDEKALEDIAAEAGIAPVEVRTHPGEARFPSIRTLVEADLRGWLPLMGVTLPDDVIERILDEAETDLAEYVTPSGEMVFEMPAVILAGKKG